MLRSAWLHGGLHNRRESRDQPESRCHEAQRDRRMERGRLVVRGLRNRQTGALDPEDYLRRREHAMQSSSTCILTWRIMSSPKAKACLASDWLPAMVFSLGLRLMAHNPIFTPLVTGTTNFDSSNVFVGDTIYPIRTQLEKWPKYPELGMVKVSYEVFKVP